MPEMKKCIQCGVELPEDALFCPECGTRQGDAPTSSTGGSEAPVTGVEAATKEQPSAPPPMDPFAPAASAEKPANAAAAFTYAMPANAPDAPQQAAYPPPQSQQPQQWGAPPPQQGTPQGWPPAPPSGQAMSDAPEKPGKQKKMKAPVMEAQEGKQPGKLPIVTLVILGLCAIGLVAWFLGFSSSKLPEFSFSATTSNGVVFSFLLMSLLAVLGAGLFRFRMRGSKLAILGDILLGIVLLVMFYGISMTMFKETNLFYKLFINITGK